jgi:hypothetical protein
MSKLSIAGSSTVSVDGADNLTLTLVDDDGNPVLGTTTVFLSVSPGAFAPASITLVDGVAAFALNAGTVTGPVLVTAADGSGDTAITTVTILPGPPSAATSSLVTSKSTVAADGTSQTTLTLTLEDAFGNRVAGTAVSLSASGSDNTFGAIEGVTDANGVFTTTLASTLGQTEIVTATAGGTQETATVTFATIPSAATSTLVASPATVTADGVSRTTLTVTVEDAGGHALAGTPVSLSANGSDNTFGAINGVTDANGVFTTTLASNLAQTETVTATEFGVQETAAVTFTAAVPSSATSTLVASPATGTADGVSQTTLKVTIEDADGHPLAGMAVSLSASGSDNAFGAINGVTDSHGVFTTTLASDLVQTETVTATEGDAQESAAVIFVPGVPPPLSLLAASNTVSPGELDQITVTLRDENGNPVAGDTPVTVSVLGDAQISNSTIILVDGIGNLTLFPGTAAGTVTVTATEGSDTAIATVTILPGPPSAATSSLVASKSTVAADGTSQTTLTVTVEDAFGNRVGGTAVSLSANGSDNVFGALNGVTDANGVFTTTLASTLAQTETVTATEGLAQEGASVTFTGGPASGPPQFVSVPGTPVGTLLDLFGTEIAAFENRFQLNTAVEDTANTDVPVAGFVANAGDTAADFVATITWGDGTTTLGTVHQVGTETFSSGNPLLPSITVNEFIVTGTHTYADEGKLPINVEIVRTTDNVAGGFSNAVTVADADVLTPAPADPIVVAPSTLAFAGTVAKFTDINAASTAGDFSATIAWGDGTTSAGAITDVDGAITVAGAHAFATTGELPITVTLAEVTPGAATAIAHNTAFVGIPLAGDVTLSSVAERALITGPIASFTDLDAGDLASAFTATIDWGDGTTSAGVVSGSNGAFTLSGTHAYSDEGSFPLSATITRTADNSTITLSGAVTATEADVLTAQPTAISANANQAFSGKVATFTDADASALAGDFSATIDWGDGATSAGTVIGGNGTFSVVGSHTFAAGGEFPVAVSVADKPPGTATAAANDVAEVTTSTPPLFVTIPLDLGSFLDLFEPEITEFENRFQLNTAVEDTANADVPVAGFVANAGDTAADFVATITWGDGTTTFGTVNQVDSQTFSFGNPIFPSLTVNEFVVTGTHTYVDEGKFPINVDIVRTTDNLAGGFNNTVTVADADVLRPAPANPIVADPATLAYDGTVANFTDVNTASTASDFIATIAWGDGTTSAGTVTDIDGAITVAGSHTFATTGELPVTVTLSEDTPGTATATATNVAEVRHTPTPTLTISIAGKAVEGSTLTATPVAGPAGDSGSVSYLWQSSADGVAFTPIAGAANSATYVLAEGDENREVRVEATFTDQFGHSVIADSNATTAVKDVPPTLSVSIAGKAVEGQTLTATPVIGTDGDGGTISYVWESSADGIIFTPIAGAANGASYVLAEGDENREVRVEATFTDDTDQSVTADSNATTSVKDVPPTLSLAIAGQAVQGQTLTAVPTIGTDADGGTIAFQWQFSTNGVTWTNITGANASTYLVQQGDGGHELRVEATFTDDTHQSVTADSGATAAVAALTANPERLVISEGTALLPITSWLLANDSSPSGKLHVTSVDGRSIGLVALAPGYSALLLPDGHGGDLVFLDVDDDVVRRNATIAPDISFTYTVSDGTHSAVATDEIAAVKVAPGGLNLASPAIGSYNFSFIYGADGNGTLTGGAGADVLVGGNGRITITGGGDGDILAAGQGPTIFNYAAPTDSRPGFTGSLANFDTVVDFDPKVDKLDFSAMSGITRVAQGPLASPTATIDPHSIAWSFDRAGDQTILYVNASGQAEHAGTTDMEVHFTGEVNFKASDFTLSGAQNAGGGNSGPGNSNHSGSPGGPGNAGDQGNSGDSGNGSSVYGPISASAAGNLLLLANDLAASFAAATSTPQTPSPLLTQNH